MNTSNHQATGNTDAEGMGTAVEFGTNVGEKLLEVREVRDLLAETDASGRERRHIHNVGTTEQKIRLIGGTGLLLAAAFSRLSPAWRIGMAAFGAMEIVTGATRYCPVWSALGINTARGEEEFKGA